MAAKPVKLFCRFDGCPRGDAITDPTTGAVVWDGYVKKSGLGAHRRRRHGIKSLGYRERRPAGGAIPCPYVDPHTRKACGVPPYQTRGGLGCHLREAHGIHSTDPNTVARRARRAAARGETPEAPTRPSPEAARLLPGARDHLRKMLRGLVRETWVAMFHTSGEVLRDTVAELCATNFEDPRDARPRVNPADSYGVAANPKRARR